MNPCSIKAKYVVYFIKLEWKPKHLKKNNQNCARGETHMKSKIGGEREREIDRAKQKA